MLVAFPLYSYEMTMLFSDWFIIDEVKLTAGSLFYPGDNNIFLVVSCPFGIFVF